MPCLPPVKDWMDYFGALTPVCITAFGAWIAWQQFRTNRDKLRLDLYQRRFHVYEAALSFYQALLESMDVESDEFYSLHKEFIKNYRETTFLFDPDVFDLMAKIFSAGGKVIGFRSHGKGQVHDLEFFMKWNSEANEAMADLEKFIFALENAIFPYLNFRKIVN